jgi:diguanylate cyclase (GGDEF)-like protein/PAS domain S-box-containing protein
MSDEEDKIQKPQIKVGISEPFITEFEQRAASLLKQIDSLFNQTEIGILTIENGLCTSINDKLLTWLGYQKDNVVGKLTISDLLTPDSNLLLNRLITDKLPTNYNNISIELLDRTQFIHRSLLSCRSYIDPISSYLVGQFTIIKSGINTLFYDDLIIQSLAFHINMGICILNERGELLQCNNAIISILGYSKQELKAFIKGFVVDTNNRSSIVKEIHDAVISFGIWEGEVPIICKNNRFIFAKLNITKVYSTSSLNAYYIGCIYDITEKVKLENQSNYIARTDMLTNLPNRRAYYEKFTREISIIGRSHLNCALAYIDLDNFKQINDTKGHGSGDKLLIEVARRLRISLRIDDLVVRMGGDEFVIIITNLNQDISVAAFQARKIATEIQKLIDKPYNLDNSEFICTASIGIAMFSKDDNPEITLKRADIAMYSAKKTGKNRIQFFDEAMQVATINQVNLDQDLRKALVNKQFELYYQPQFNLDKCITSAEALLRWNHPTKGVIEAEDFISFAEDNGLILPIGEWVLENACNKLKAWKGNPSMREIKLAINISPRQFEDKDFIRNTVNIIHKSGIDPTFLVFEITESIVHDLASSLKIMDQLKRLGITFSMDDFGTGYSSLAVLIELPITQLKIDKKFVKSITSSKSAKTVIETIIAMSRILHVDFIAEGVETDTQFRALISLGCNSFQGNFLSPAINLNLFEQLPQKR